MTTTYLHSLLLYRTITPLHVGCGQDLGVVDLPVIRERTTGHPFIPGSGIRGSLRDACGRPRTGIDVELLFGPAAEDGEEVRYAGCLAVHDARLLLFPVRSDRGVFLWITCPAVLARLAGEMAVFTPGGSALAAVPSLASHVQAAPPAAPASEDAAAAPAPLGDDELLGPEALAAGDAAAPGKKGPPAPLYLEEYAFTWREGGAADAAARTALAAWAAAVGKECGVPDLAARTVVVSDRTFHHFVTHATIVVQRNRLTSAKNVEPGALFSLEAVPPEAVFHGFVGGTVSRRPPGDGETRLQPAAVLAELRKLWLAQQDPAALHLHLGGDEGTGLGVTRLSWATEADATAMEDEAPTASAAETGR